MFPRLSSDDPENGTVRCTSQISRPRHLSRTPWFGQDVSESRDRAAAWSFEDNFGIPFFLCEGSGQRFGKHCCNPESSHKAASVIRGAYQWGTPPSHLGLVFSGPKYTRRLIPLSTPYKIHIKATSKPHQINISSISNPYQIHIKSISNPYEHLGRTRVPH